jgi:hypothetical protein
MGFKWLPALAVVIVLAACSGINVSQDYDPATTFQGMDSFAWSSPTQSKTGDPRIDNPLRDTRIREAVARVLTQKGFHPASDGTPAFLMQYQYVLRRKIDSGGGSPSIGFGVGSYGRHGGIAVGTSTGNTISEYDEGSLVLDFLDPQSEELLWRGTGTQIYRQYDDPAKDIRDIDALVEKILAQFPP